MPEEQQQQQTPQGVTPYPVPTAFSLGVLPVGGKDTAFLTIDTPSGSTIVFLDHVTAERLGNELLTVATRARTGLIVPGSTAITSEPKPKDSKE